MAEFAWPGGTTSWLAHPDRPDDGSPSNLTMQYSWLMMTRCTIRNNMLTQTCHFFSLSCAPVRAAETWFQP